MLTYLQRLLWPQRLPTFSHTPDASVQPILTRQLKPHYIWGDSEAGWPKLTNDGLMFSRMGNTTLSIITKVSGVIT